MTTISRQLKNEQLIRAVNSLNLGFPIVELAEKMGVDKGNVSTYLNNKKPASKNFIKKFEEVYNIKVDDFKTKNDMIIETKKPQSNDSGLKDKLIQILESSLKRVEDELQRVLAENERLNNK